MKRRALAGGSRSAKLFNHAQAWRICIEFAVRLNRASHVPLLFNPVFADYMQAYGAGGQKASRLDACELLARLYWYTVEFGLIDTPQGVRAYGSGILSSAGELRYAVTDPQPQRLAFRLERLMRTEYKIDTYQANYFVIDSFSQLFQATAPDFTPIYTAVRRLPPIAPGIRLPGERNYPAGAAKSGGVRAW